MRMIAPFGSLRDWPWSSGSLAAPLSPRLAYSSPYSGDPASTVGLNAMTPMLWLGATSPIRNTSRVEPVNTLARGSSAVHSRITLSWLSASSSR